MNKTIEEKLKIMDLLYSRMEKCTSTGGRIYNYMQMVELYDSDQEIAKIWDYDPSQTKYIDKFTKKYNVAYTEKSNYKAKRWIEENSYCGLYLLVQTSFDIITEEKKYFVKSGQSVNIDKRMKSYMTHNPAYKLISTLPMEENLLDVAEDYTHECLNNVSIHKVETSAEWFEVDRKTFFMILEQKFKYFGFKEKSFDEI